MLVLIQLYCYKVLEVFYSWECDSICGPFASHELKPLGMPAGQLPAIKEAICPIATNFPIKDIVWNVSLLLSKLANYIKLNQHAIVKSPSKHFLYLN
jgi:hypothetical protein